MRLLRCSQPRLAQKMKKISVAIFCVLLISFLSFPVQGFAARPITVTVNGRALAMDVSPVVRDGRTLVPLRSISNALGVNLHWDAKNGRIVAWRWTYAGETRAVVLYINSKTAWRGDLVKDFPSLGYIVIGNNPPSGGVIANKAHGGEQIALDAAPVIIGGRTMVPLRFIAENFDVTVTWHHVNRTVNIITEAGPLLTIQPPFVPQRQKLSSGEVTARVMPAVVRIDTHRGLGSGFFVSPEGLIVTNAHVVRGSRQIVVTTHTGERFSATIAKIANWHDLALLRVNASPLVRFPFLSDNPAAGDIPQGEEVLAFGSPLGLTATVTRGIVSAWQNKDVAFGAWTDNSIRVLQHEAAIAPGSSGGPLVNLYGEWVGVNTLVRADWAGFGFAVPAEYYHALLRQGDYSLRCDWESYYTEEFSLRKKDLETTRLLDEALAIQTTGVRAERLSMFIAGLHALRQEAGTYQPLYPEVQNLHRLYLAQLDARIAVWTFARNSEINPLLWNSAHWDLLAGNSTRAWDAYVSEWSAINARFQ